MKLDVQVHLGPAARPKDRLKLLQASQLSQTIRGKGELAVVGGKTAWMPERVVAYNQAGREVAECWATTSEGNVCDRPAGAPPATMTPGESSRAAALHLGVADEAL